MQYETKFYQYFDPGSHQNSFALDTFFLNNGSTAVIINGFSLGAGDSLRISGDGDGSMDSTIYNFSGSGINLVVINRQKI